MKILLTLFVLFLFSIFFYGCSSKIVTESGSTRYLENDSAYTDIAPCELMCIGNRNFPTMHNSLWEKYSLFVTENRKRNYGEEIVNACTDYKKELDWDSISQKYNNPEKIYSCATSGELSTTYYPYKKHAVCRPFNQTNSEVEEINYLLKQCNKEATDRRILSSKDYMKNQEIIKKNFEEKIEKKYDDIIATCNKLGFKKGTESNGNCVLEIIKTQKELAEINKKKSEPPPRQIIIQKENNLNSSLLLMQMGLNLMSPPRPQLNCRFVFNTMQCY